MIRKIIASDIDGTLLPYGETELDPELFNLIEDLAKKDVLFVPASGRGIRSIREKFAPVEDKISYLSENGSVVWYYDKIISEFPFPRPLLDEVVSRIYRDPNLECLVTSARNGYIITDNVERSREIQKNVDPKSKLISARSDAVISSSLENIPETIVKTTAFCFPQKASLYFDDLKDEFGDRIEVAKAGPNVVDFIAAGKGDGLKVLADYLHLKPEDLYTFGDNYNDISMLKVTPNSYIIETDDPVLRASSKHTTKNPIEELKRIFYKV